MSKSKEAMNQAFQEWFNGSAGWLRAKAVSASAARLIFEVGFTKGYVMAGGDVESVTLDQIDNDGQEDKKPVDQSPKDGGAVLL